MIYSTNEIKIRALLAQLGVLLSGEEGVTYEEVLAVFAPNANNTNIDFGVYVNPETMLNQITLNFNTAELEQEISTAVVTANNYTDEQIANLNVVIEPNELPFTTINLANVSNNPTNQWTTLASYQGNCAFQSLLPTNNYIINMTFDNGKIVGNAGNTGVIVPPINLQNINDYMMCPIVLDNSNLTSSYIFVTISCVITNRYTGPDTISNQAANFYLNNTELNYLNHIQSAPDVPVPYFYSLVSSAPISVGSTYTFTKTFYVNNAKAIPTNNFINVNYGYNAVNFCGVPSAVPPGRQWAWEDIIQSGFPLSQPYPLAQYSYPSYWTRSNSNFFYQIIDSTSFLNITMDYDWCTVNPQSNGVGEYSGVATVNLNSCYLFLNNSILTSNYLPINITVNYRMKVPFNTLGNGNKIWNIYLAVILQNTNTLPSTVPSVVPKPILISAYNFTSPPGTSLLGIQTGTFTKTIYVNNVGFTTENPNNVKLLSALQDVNVESVQDNYLLRYNGITNTYEPTSIINLTNITYKEADFLNDNPNFTIGVGPFLESIVLQNYNYTYILPYVYFNFDPDINFNIDATNIDATSNLNLIIDNSQNQFQFNLNISCTLSILSTLNPPQTNQNFTVLKYQIIIPAFSIGTYNFVCTAQSISKIGENIDVLTYSLTTVQSYLENYTNDVNKQWTTTGFYCAYFSDLGSITNYNPITQPVYNYQLGQYFNINKTPNFFFGGDPRFAYSFLPSHPGREEFWKFRSYSLSFSPHSIFEDRIKTANSNVVTPSQNLYSRIARVVMKPPLEELEDPFIQTENAWEKEFGYLRWVLLNDPTNFINYIDKIEIFGWDGAGNNVYLSLSDSGTIYDNSSNTLLAMNNTFSFIQNLQSLVATNNDFYEPGAAPYYEIYPKDYSQQYWQLGNNQITSPNVFPFPYPNFLSSRWDIYNTTINIDRPPVFFQGLFTLTFDNYVTFNNLLTLSFSSFGNFQSTVGRNFIYPLDLYASNYTNTWEPGLKTVFNLLTSNTSSSTPPIPTYVPPSMEIKIPFSGYSQFIF